MLGDSHASDLGGDLVWNRFENHLVQSELAGAAATDDAPGERIWTGLSPNRQVTPL